VEIEETQRVARRGILAAGIGGAAISLLPFLTGRASAATETAPPKRPTSDDVSLLATAQQVELTATALYTQAIADVKGWTAEQAAVMVAMREAHLAFANSLSAILGKAAPGAPLDDLLASLGSSFAGDATNVIKAAADLESTAVATHTDVLGRLVGIDGAALIASIQIAEARHTTVLRSLAGSSDLAELLVDTEAASLLGNA
jgi:Ferritin-like domain